MTYKFYIDYGSGDTQVYPLNEDELKVTAEVYSGQLFKRLVLSDDVVFHNDTTEDNYDYNIIAAIAGNVEITFKIKRSRDSYASVWWQGYFSTYDGEFDADECIVSIPIETDDAYRPFVENWDKEYNILDISSDLLIKDTIYPVLETMTILQGTNSATKALVDQVRYTYGAQWTFVSYTGSAGNYTGTWYRYRLRYKPNNNIITVTYGDGDVDYFWELEEEDYYYGDSTLAITGDYSFDVYYYGSKLLTEIMDHIVDDIDSLTYDSDFFLSPTNPISGESNPLLRLSLGSRSDYIGIPSDPATIANTTLGDLLDVLANMFQTYMYISGGVLYLEHARFFQNGNSYSVPSVGLDLTAAAYSKFIEQTNKYKYIRREMIKNERWTFLDAEGEDFVGKDIEYAQISSNARYDDSTKEYNVQKIVTDINNVQLTKNDSDTEGFMMLALYIGSPTYPTSSMVSYTPDTIKDAYSPVSISYVGSPTYEHTLSLEYSGAKVPGVKTDAFDVAIHCRVKVTYTLVVNSGEIPRMQLTSDSFGDVRFSSTEVLVAGTHTVELIAERLGSCRLNVFNMEGEAVDCDIVMKIEIDATTIRTGTGILSTDTGLKNETISLARLHDSYWKDYRPLWNGTMNGVAVTFNSIQRTILQKSFFISVCCVSFDFYQLIKTNMGDGLIHIAIVNLKDGTIDLELLYQDMTGIGSGIGSMEIEDTFIIG